MAIPVIQQIRVGSYILKQKLLGREKYPLVLMLEPLFRCNLACAGCGKIDYPKEILNQRLSAQECIDSVEECGAPIVSIPGGEPLIHREMPEIVRELIKRKKFVYLCTNAVLMEKKLSEYTPSPYFTWSVHLDGMKEEHDKAVCQEGVFERCVSAIKKAKSFGVKRIKGEFIPTTKNKPAENFYEKLGFNKENGFWVFNTVNTIKRPEHIKVVKDE